MIRINLLAAERPTQAKGPKAAPGALQAYVFIGMFVGLSIVGCGLAWMRMTKAIQDIDAQITADKKREQQLQAIKAKVEDFQARKKTYEEKISLIERLKAEQGGPVHMLDEISQALPELVWLTELTQIGQTVNINGASNSMTSVADFMSGLSAAGKECGKANKDDRTDCWFPKVDLVDTAEQTPGIVSFKIQATFVSPEVAKKEAAAAAAEASQAAQAKPTAPGKKKK